MQCGGSDTSPTRLRPLGLVLNETSLTKTGLILSCSGRTKYTPRSTEVRAGWNSVFDSHDQILALIPEAIARRHDLASAELTVEMPESWARSLAETGLTTRQIAPIVGASVAGNDAAHKHPDVRD